MKTTLEDKNIVYLIKSNDISLYYYTTKKSNIIPMLETQIMFTDYGGKDFEFYKPVSDNSDFELQYIYKEMNRYMEKGYEEKKIIVYKTQPFNKDVNTYSEMYQNLYIAEDSSGNLWNKYSIKDDINNYFYSYLEETVNYQDYEETYTGTNVIEYDVRTPELETESHFLLKVKSFDEIKKQHQRKQFNL